MVTFGSHVGNHQFQPFLSGVYAGVIFKMYFYAEVRTTAQSVRAQGKRTCQVQPNRANRLKIMDKIWQDNTRSFGKLFAQQYWSVVEPYPSEKYEFVSWDDDIPNIWTVIKFHGSIIYYYIPFYPIKNTNKSH